MPVRAALMSDFSRDDLEYLAGWRARGGQGVDLRGLLKLVSSTRQVGGKVAKVTLNAAAWARAFGDDADGAYLVRTVTYGADARYVPVPASKVEPGWEVRNCVEDRYAAEVSKKVAGMLERGEIVPVGPEFPSQGVSAIIVVDKYGKIRVCHDLSRPKPGSINEGIKPYLEKRKFASIEDAFALLYPGASMAKIDVTAAYRSIPMAPEWFPRHVFQWEGRLYADLRMPFGNAAAPGIFDHFTQAFVRLVRSKGFHGVVGFLDDFILVV